MASWLPVFQHITVLRLSSKERFVEWRFHVPSGVKALRLRVTASPLEATPDPRALQEAFQRYRGIAPPAECGTAAPGCQTDLENAFERAYTALPAAPGFYLFDPIGAYRGRWDPSFHSTFRAPRSSISPDWRWTAERSASDGWMAGRIQPGEWTLRAPRAERGPIDCRVMIEIECSEEDISAPLMLRSYTFPDAPQEEDAKGEWRVGELDERSSRSAGTLAPEEIAQAYGREGYRFVCVSDDGVPPLERLNAAPAIDVVRGQTLIASYGEMQLIGARRPAHLFDAEGEKSIDDLAREAHEAGALLAIRRPFGLSRDGRVPAWRDDAALAKADLLQIWPGIWEERFPEIRAALEAWDRLLKQGARVFGYCGKGPESTFEPEVVERLPKTVLWCEGAGESAILAALAQGRCYATVEPVVSLWVESEYGGAQMGGEMRLPAGSPYALRVHVSQMERGFVVIKSQDGVYCQMPLASTRETTLRFLGKATQRVEWFRVEVYRFGRPLDRLLALTNPVFVRGLVSV